MDDILNAMNEQYEEVDSKQEKAEEEVKVEEILKSNEETVKWIERELEHQEDAKNGGLENSAFTRKKVESKLNEKRDEKKEEKKSSYYSPYSSSSSSGSGYKSPYSSSSTTTKNSDELFHERVEKAFNGKVKRLAEATLNKHLNRIEEELQWDILDLQHELNKRRIADRDYENELATINFEKTIEKRSNACSRKIDLAEVLILLKVNPYGK